MPRKDDNEELAIRSRIKPAMRAHRESNEWTQRQMAAYLGVTPKNYEAYESKPERGVPAGVIAKFCKLTKTDVTWIMLGIPAEKMRKIG